GDRERLLLQISAILHASGKFVSIMKGTDSSYQIIMATEIIGISHLEREIVANVVRYNMQEYAYNQVALNAGLSQYKGIDASGRDITILIAKLTAILRLANSMDRSHNQKLSDCKMAVKGENLVITTGYIGNMVLEQSSFEQKADFFEEIFGIRPILKQKRRV
ncbi:MAG: exopolyphosphatase, partial [Clostridium sp.]